MKAPHNGYFLSLHKQTVTKNTAKSKGKQLSQCVCQSNSFSQQFGGLAYADVTHAVSFVVRDRKPVTDILLKHRGTNWQATRCCSGSVQLSINATTFWWSKILPSVSKSTLAPAITQSETGLIQSRSRMSGLGAPSVKVAVFLEDGGHLKGRLLWPLFSGQTSHLPTLWR